MFEHFQGVNTAFGNPLNNESILALSDNKRVALEWG